jgi:transposase
MEPCQSPNVPPSAGIRLSFASGLSGWFLEAFQHTGERHGVVTRVATQLGVGSESLRQWVKQAEVDSGRRAGTTTEDKLRISQLEREVRELRRANEILSASAFFARELDPRLPK